MKIIFLLPQLVYGRHGGFVGGYVNSVINMMEALQTRAQLVLVAGVSKPSVEGEGELRGRLGPTQLCLLPMKSRPSSSAYAAEFAWRTQRACRRLRAERADIVYGHSGHPVYGLITWLSARAARARAVHALYCPVGDEFQHRKMGRGTRLLIRQAFRRVPQQIAISENVRATVRKFTGNRADPHVILPAIPDAFVAVRSKSGPVGGRSLVLGFVGHHKPEKGFDMALDAISDAAAGGADVSLLAVISGAESQGRAGTEIKEMLEERDLNQRVRLLTGVRDIREFYAQIDLMLIPFRGTRGPSDYPMVMLEAMGLGVPVVCTGVGAIPEAIDPGQNGFLATDANRTGFSAALIEAIAAIRVRRDDISARAVATAERFRATQVANATMDHFTKLIQRPSNER
jgi:glycosyltransferase involved in cell wall biosynthesis